MFFLIYQSRPLFVYFRPFLITISILQIEKSVDGVLGIRTQGHIIVGADNTIELWQPLPSTHVVLVKVSGPSYNSTRGANFWGTKNENFFEKCFWWWSSDPSPSSRAKNFLKLQKFSFVHSSEFCWSKQKVWLLSL